MKRCPECRRDYYDDTLLYCLEDGTALVQGSVPSPDEPATAILSVRPAIAGGLTQPTDETDVKTAILQPPATVGGTDSARGFEKRLLAAPFLLAIIVLGGFFGFRYFKATESGTNKSIAVLPFQNKSGDPNSDYLSDGLAESLIYRLSRLSNLKVSPTSSVNQYKGKDTKVTAVANELGVDAVLTGRLTQVGDNFTISVELVDVRNNRLLWGEHYEHKMSELLTTQREIATEITQKLKLRLSGESAQKLAKKYTDSDAAYQIFLKGRYHFGKRTRDDIFKGINYFRQATELDPNFALAYVGMADSYISGTANGYFPRNEGYSNGKAAAQRALEIDPTLAEAHSSLANSLSNGDWNWNEAESEYKTAIELDPNVANSHYYYGLHLQRIGQTNKALAEIKRAVELEPLSLVINSNLAAAYLFDRQYDLAFEVV